jgi:hypothetical protein
MRHTSLLKRTGTGALTLVALVVTGTPFAARLGAQITEVARTPVAETAQLTFGYRCDDRFVIRNDGAKPVDLEYAIEKGTEHTKLTLGSRELVELDSKSKDPMELWMDGKLIAKAIKEKRSCKDVAGSASVLVAPLEVQTNERDQPQYATRGYPFYDPFLYGYGYGYGYYGAFGYRPFYAGFVGVQIIIGGRRGPGRRGR